MLKRLKTRGSKRRPYDVLVRQDSQVIRLGLDLSGASRINRRGVTIPYKEVKSCTRQSLRRQVLDRPSPQLHFCREENCQEGGEDVWHVPAYALVDPEVMLDVRDYSSMTPTQALGVTLRTCGQALWRVLWAPSRWLCQLRCRRRICAPALAAQPRLKLAHNSEEITAE